MSDLPGNPHVFEGPQIASPETIENDFIGEEGVTAETMILSELTRNTEATLALAYEQRTANLLKVLELQGRMHDAQQAFNLSAFDVAERLGLGDNK